MTEPEGDSQAISVAELLARNGQSVGSGSSGGRRRRGVAGGISVAELTGEFPIVRKSRAVSNTAAETDTAAAADAETPATDTPAAADPIAATPVVEDTAPEPVKTPEPRPVAEPVKIVEPPKAPEPPKTPEPQAPVVVEAPTVVTPAVTAAFGPSSRASAPVETPSVDASATTVIPQVPTLAHSSKPEPGLLSGQTVAGDLLRQDRSAATETASTDAPAADTPAAEESDDDLVVPEPEQSGTKQWAVLLGQGAVAVVAGALMFKGFEKLWDMLPMVALVLSVLVIVGLVAMVRILRRTDDITSLVIALVAGVFVTLGPLAFLLSTS